MTLYKSAWWSLELPAGWSGKEDEGCHTFENASSAGAFQVSAYRKEELVTDDDLREFASDVPLRAVAFGEFTGFRAHFSDDGNFWIKWWLRAGETMLHATYNCALEERREEEEALIERALGSLRSSSSSG